MAFRQDYDDYVLYLALGWTAWRLIAGCITQGARSLNIVGGMLQQTQLPLSMFLFQTLANNIIIFFLNLSVFILLILLLGHAPTLTWAWAVPGFFLVLWGGFTVISFLSLVCARIPDLMHVLTVLTRIAFFVTPILWHVEVLRDAATSDTMIPGGIALRAFYVDYNPLYHFIELLRASFGGSDLP